MIELEKLTDKDVGKWVRFRKYDWKGNVIQEEFGRGLEWMRCIRRGYGYIRCYSVYNWMGCVVYSIVFLPIRDNYFYYNQ